MGISLHDSALLITAYLLGSIPFGVIITRLAGTVDIRTHGSCNIGATNVLRLAGKKLALLTLLLDSLKGTAAIILARYVTTSETLILLSAAFSVTGHIFPIWLKFKGGRGVATMLAVLLTISWPVGVAVCLVWFVTFKISHISSVSSLTASVFSPLLALFFIERGLAPQGMVQLAFFLSLLVIFRHKDNIGRLLKGEEQRSNLKK